MAWLLAVVTLFLQAPDAGEGVDPWLVLPPSVGPELERIMSEQNLESRLGAGWKFGDARITPTSITVKILHQEQPAAVITMERPQVGDSRPVGAWFAYRIETLTDTTLQIEAALMEIAGALVRGFSASPWKSPGGHGDRSRLEPEAEPESHEVPCGFCSLASRSWPFHYTRHPWISLTLGALIVIALALGVFVGLRHSRALKGIF